MARVALEKDEKREATKAQQTSVMNSLLGELQRNDASCLDKGMLNKFIGTRHDGTTLTSFKQSDSVLWLP
jgi:hypothetical protein